MSKDKEYIPPFQFIKYEGGKFILNKKFRKKFTRIKEEIHVIGICGRYRTGKSYFLNRLFRTQGGFLLGKTIESATKGLWLWAKRIDGKMYFLLDTEGLYVPKTAGVNYDNKIISLCLLLSGFFLLNTTGVIDRSSITQLEFVVELTKNIRAFSAREAQLGDFKEIFPQFIWLVRDFFLELKNDRGEYLADNEYLEEMLQVTDEDRDSLDTDMHKINRTKDYVKEMFPKRNCFTLVQPTGDASQLHRVHEMEFDDLDRDFTTKMDTVVKFVLEGTPAKGMFKKKWTGGIFWEMAKEFVEHINSDKFITMDTSFDEVVKRNNEKMVEEAREQYTSLMEEKVKDTLPTDEEKLMSIHKEVLEDTIDFFSRVVYEEAKESVEQKAKKFEEEIIVKDDEGNVIGGLFFEKYVKINEEMSETKCRDVLKQLWKKIDRKFNDLIQAKDPVAKYESMVEDIKKKYFDTEDLGPKAKISLKQYIDERSGEKKKLEGMKEFVTGFEEKHNEMLKKIEDQNKELEKLQEEKRKINEDAEKERLEREKKERELEELEGKVSKMESEHEKKLREMAEREKEAMEKMKTKCGAKCIVM